MVGRAGQAAAAKLGADRSVNVSFVDDVLSASPPSPLSLPPSRKSLGRPAGPRSGAVRKRARLVTVRVRRSAQRRNFGADRIVNNGRFLVTVMI